MKYKSVVVTQRGGPDVLQVIENDLRPPSSGEVRARILAVSVCAPDISSRYGHTPFAPKMPFVPGYAVIGDVDAIGVAVTQAAVGDRVAALTVYGGYAEYIYLMYSLASKSKHSTLIEYGATPIDYHTEDFVEVIRRAEPAGLDAVFDGVGGDDFKRGFGVLRRACKSFPSWKRPKPMSCWKVETSSAMLSCWRQTCCKFISLRNSNGWPECHLRCLPEGDR